MKTEIWDLPTRFFHWAFAASFAAAFAASRVERLLDFHMLAGASVLALAAFRVLWGFSGNRHARFSSFLRGWSETKGFLAGLLRLSPASYAGHNPAVGWAVVTMLAFAVVLGATGIIVYSGEEMRGPLAGWFSFESAQAAGVIHAAAAWGFLALAAVHVSAALLHDIIWKEGLVLSMLTGRKSVEEISLDRVSRRPLLRKASFVVLAGVLGGALTLVVPERQAQDYSPALVRADAGWSPVERNMTYEEECGSCHNAFSPVLLPLRSWSRVMAGLDDHFGDDASLPEETSSEILEWLEASSAERALTEPSKKLLMSIGEGTPLRITETEYWEQKHSGLGEDVYSRKSVSSRTNCAACHPGALLGSFEDRDISVPRG